MSFFSLENLSNILILIYLGAIGLIGIISLITFVVFFNNAEKRSVASTVALLYATLFIIISTIGISLLASLN